MDFSLMDPNPVSQTMEDVARALIRLRVVQVHLEPGDAARYDFIITPLPIFSSIEYLGVLRSYGGVGGGFRSGAFLSRPEKTDEHHLNGEYYRLADGNEHTRMVFQWWFGHLWSLL